MNNKKYQIFISSTYTDLKEERQQILEAVLNLGNLPVGMELFGAGSDEQFEYIKRIIDDSDYYVVLVGGRYGSIHSKTGKSYTEMEFDYAVQKNIPVLAFLYKDISKLPKEKRDNDTRKIEVFREKVQTNRIVKFWDNMLDLVKGITPSLVNEFAKHPRQGWIRPENIDTQELLVDLNKLRKEKEKLENQIKIGSKQIRINPQELVPLDDFFGIKYKRDLSGRGFQKILKISWSEIFKFIAPHLYTGLSYGEFVKKMRTFVKNNTCSKDVRKSYDIDINDIQQIKFQFAAHKLIEIKYTISFTETERETLFITEKGSAYLADLMTVKMPKKGKKGVK